MSNPWPTCSVESCIGIRIQDHNSCLVHLELKDQTRFFKSATPGMDLDLRGTDLTGPILEQLFYATIDVDGRSTFGEVSFERASIAGVHFRSVKFAGPANFCEVRFSDVMFDWPQFLGGARFDQAVFDGSTIFRQSLFVKKGSFENVLFKGDVTFDRGNLPGGLDFEESKFHREAVFSDLKFEGGATFDGSEFDEWVEFVDVSIGGNVSFRDVAFKSRLAFSRVTVDGCANFAGGVLARDFRFNLSAKEYILTGATFQGRVSGNFDDCDIDCEEAAFGQGFSLTLNSSRVSLERVVIGGPSILSGGVFSSLVSLREMAVDELLITDFDLSRCSFLGAHNLDKLRFEGICKFDSLKRRQVLVEELVWRADKLSPVGPRRIVNLYRQLRKAQEDSKNEPGAADFYYGEMEMRRLSPATSRPDRATLYLYWLVSGYGLRALRALATLAVLIALATVGFWLIGFKTTPAFGDTLIYVAQSTVSLETKLTSLPKDLTPFGEVMRLVMRVLGPLLLGLTLLAVRNRVKR